MEILWRRGVSMDAAATTLGLTFKQFQVRWKKLYGPEAAAWLGETVDLYHNPVCGGTRASFRLKTGHSAFMARAPVLHRFCVGLELQMVWVWDYVRNLPANFPVIELMTGLLGDRGYIFHVSPLRAPRASLCLGVPPLLLLLLLLLFIHILSCLRAVDS